jgi:poly-beta-1,6-N-acetyl-D-glucosamine synthase
VYIHFAEQLLLLAIMCSTSMNAVLWSIVGLMRKLFEVLNLTPHMGREIKLTDVAVVIAARNEELALPSCLKAVTAIIPAGNVFIGDDASFDATAMVASELGCKVFSARTNMGKSKILDATIREFRLCDEFSAILILDADSQIDANFLRNALPILGQRNVAVVAGHFVSRKPAGGFSFGHIIHLYRKRLYFVLQTFFRFGQSWGPINFSIVAPGFASLYRADVIAKLNIAEPGLIIEDINMTFEVHKKRLGRIAYSPTVRCTTEDPTTLGDYSKQMKRWSLGLWQTISKQGIWPSKFWLFLTLYLIEMLIHAVSITMLAALTVATLYVSGMREFWVPSFNGFLQLPIFYLPFILLLTDIFVSALTSLVTRDWRILFYAPLFPIMRAIDIFWLLATIPLAWTTKSDGRWSSPARRIPVN